MGQPFQNDITAGSTLIISAIQSANFVNNVSGWQISQNGNAQFNTVALEGNLVITGEAAGDGIFIYTGTPASGTLIGSWTTTGGTDAYGNVYTAGLNVTAGTLQGVSIVSSNISGDSIIQGASVSGGTISGTAISQGSITETTIIFDSGGGDLLVYGSSSTTVTLTSGTSWTAPAGTYTTAKVECWGAGAGGGGGSAGSDGGEAGGGGAYACEPAYPISPGTVYPYQIGAGGTGGYTGNGGTSGGSTAFNGGGIFGSGGSSGSGGNGGSGGATSGNTVCYAGGNGGNDLATGTGGAGGGGSGGATGAGGNGHNSSSSSGATGGTAGTGGGAAGGTGGAAAANGVAGSAPGGGGGGAGEGTTVNNINKTYKATSTDSYYGAGVGGGLRNTNGSMFQGDPDVPVTTFPGDQESFMNVNYSQIRSDFSGATIDSVSFGIYCAHSWYDSGCYAILGYATSSGNNYNTCSFWCPVNEVTNADITSYGFPGVIASTLEAFILGPSSSTAGGSGDLYNYGYFNGGTSGGPSVTVNGHTSSTGSYKAGNGAGGQIKITYTSARTLLCSIAPAAGSDGVNSYPAGFGRLEGTQYTQLRGTQTDQSIITTTTGAYVAITKAYTVPAADAVVGTTYRLSAWGTGTWGATLSVLGMGITASGIASLQVPTTAQTISAGMYWKAEAIVQVLTSSTANMSLTLWTSQHATGGYAGVGYAQGTSFIIANSNTLDITAEWGTASDGTITCDGSIFERLGP